MSDLISRSELTSCLSDYALNESPNDNESTSEKRISRLIYNAIQKCISYVEEEPTAYDIDKVVEELKERTDFLNGCTKYGNKNAKQQAESYSTMMMYEVADLVDDLIEIVKQGGVSDSSNDVCVWYKVNGNAYKCYTHAEIYDSRVLDWCKCPYCEKKIKIVGD